MNPSQGVRCSGQNRVSHSSLREYGGGFDVWSPDAAFSRPGEGGLECNMTTMVIAAAGVRS
jgi:hypothetical protein